MRAGLIAGALLTTLAIAASEAVARPLAETVALAQAPVPCNPRSDGNFDCQWFRPGNGITGGSIVAVGTTTVGYLHQGSNWIVCQQKGGDVRSAEGYRNHWFAWTTADNNRQGWASAVDAQGGEDYGQFRGVPSCNGAHGSPPSYNGVWGSPPAPSPGAPAPVPTDPSTPAVDADQDGVPATADCDDFSRHVYPGAPEVAGDNVDQDCNGADAAGRVSALVAYRGSIARRWTKFTSLRVTEAPPGATVHVSCTGKRKGCPKSQTFTTSAKGSVSLTKLFRKRLRVGAVVYVTVSTPNAVARVRKLSIRRDAVRGQTLCQAPGVLEPTKC